MGIFILLFFVKNVATRSLVCPPGWVSVSEYSGCVLFHTNVCQGGCGWIEAMTECQKLNSWLLEIHSKEEQQFIAKMAQVSWSLNLLKVI